MPAKGKQSGCDAEYTQGNGDFNSDDEAVVKSELFLKLNVADPITALLNIDYAVSLGLFMDNAEKGDDLGKGGCHILLTILIRL